MNENLLLAFGLTLIAGLSTGIGSVVALLVKRTNTRFLAFSMGLSGGVMIYVSFTEILGKAHEALGERFGDNGPLLTVVAFFAGIAIIGLIDHFVPAPSNPHHAGRVEDLEPAKRPDKLLRMGVFTALAIAIHNFPEGMATFASALADPALGISIAVAIAIHNIPEGIAVSVPVYYATGSRKKAFWLSFASGLSEPLGAVVGYLLLRSFMGPGVMGILLAGVAGVMVFISLDELLPTAREYDEGHLAIYGVVSGMAVMAASLLLLG